MVPVSWWRNKFGAGAACDAPRAVDAAPCCWLCQEPAGRLSPERAPRTVTSTAFRRRGPTDVRYTSSEGGHPPPRDERTPYSHPMLVPPPRPPPGARWELTVRPHYGWEVACVSHPVPLGRVVLQGGCCAHRRSLLSRLGRHLCTVQAAAAPRPEGQMRRGRGPEVETAGGCPPSHPPAGVRPACYRGAPLRKRRRDRRPSWAERIAVSSRSQRPRAALTSPGAPRGTSRDRGGPRRRPHSAGRLAGRIAEVWGFQPANRMVVGVCVCV